MKVARLIELLRCADPNAYVVCGSLHASLLPEITTARQVNALRKTKEASGIEASRFIEMSQENANCKMVILK